MRRRPRIVLVGGWSWHRHVGDDLILAAHIEALARALPRHRPVVVGSDAERLADRIGQDCAWSAAPALWALAGGTDPGRSSCAGLRPLVDACVAAVLGGGEGLDRLAALSALLTEADAVVGASAGSLAGAFPLAVAEQAVVLEAAQALGKPTVVSGVSLGPFADSGDWQLIGPALAGAGVVVVRDRMVSERRALTLGVRPERLRVAPDPALCVSPAPVAAVSGALARAGVDPRAPYALVTAAPWQDANRHLAAVAAAAGALGRAGLNVIGLPMFVGAGAGDEGSLDQVAELVGPEVSLRRLRPLPDDRVVAALCRRAETVVGSRYHGAVLAAAGGRPALLLHEGAYQRDKAESLAAAAPSVTAAQVGGGTDLLASLAIGRSPGAPVLANGPPPAITWLAGRLRPRTVWRLR